MPEDVPVAGRKIERDRTLAEVNLGSKIFYLLHLHRALCPKRWLFREFVQKYSLPVLPHPVFTGYIQI